MTKPLQLLVVLALCWGCQPKQLVLEKDSLTSPTGALLQAISHVDQQTTWVSGHEATFLRTTDGGQNWEAFVYEQGDTLQFRDLHAFSKDKVLLMSAGPGELSQIIMYEAGAGFRQVYQMPYVRGFLNTIEFWDDQKGLAFGDSFDGELFVLKTEDGGETWSRIDPATLPAAGEGEGGFAASGTCIAVQPEGKAWIATGAGGNARVLMTQDFGNSWTYTEAPLIRGDAAGVTSIRMLDAQQGTIVGGDLALTDGYSANIAQTTDGGKNWTLQGPPVTKGAFYGSDLFQAGAHQVLVVCGPNGLDYAVDNFTSFSNLDSANYWAVDFNAAGVGYAVGTEGKILRLKTALQ
ncbi:beta propeller repeat protein [Marinoscillum furvescens]|uniref:Photosystem II stability/assembly factor-like uncharacterized protein n=1 Tax=Marinoscillum furvescens DSM 4134 TaxID=1122208 RepID=A0A3D9L8B3_MARFU|nr:hypothetical protein [Marinoscillum furvescens]REE01743.1 photosystem II stability/assembly factor-like uncharacterized protein [Marinoscillum furvescens DSM 4134]